MQTARDLKNNSVVGETDGYKPYIDFAHKKFKEQKHALKKHITAAKNGRY